MTSQNSHRSEVVHDSLRVFLDGLAARAAVVLREHIDAGNHCAACGLTWPCSRAVLADHNLEMARP